MRAPLRGLAVALACLLIFCLSSFAYAQQSDQIVAERILGPHWKQLSRRAGMIFAGTVLSTTPLAERAMPGPTPAVEVRFRVDEPIAGVEPGQVLTIHEWAGAWSMHRPMINGQHILIFLYPPSRLGLTSPVGGSMGQVALDPSGKSVSKDLQTQDLQNPVLHKPDAQAPPSIGLRSSSSGPQRTPVDSRSVSVLQLERAIRSAREE
ncbi:MAG: hypothetical protein ABSB87_16800 [Terriglobales bacterium]|jgi:hypothetical protein